VYTSSLALELIGTVVTESDGSIFDRKRLMITDIRPREISGYSLIDWKVMFQHLVNMMRKYLYDLLLELASPYQGGLIIAVVLGNTEWLADSRQPYFKVTGTLHILAASGQNIALVLLMVEPLIPIILPIKLRGLMLLVVVWMHLILVGLQPSVTRAGLMASLALLSKYMFFSQYRSFYGLCLTAGVLLIFRPEWIISMGFILSLCATAGIILLYPLIIDLIGDIVALFSADKVQKKLKTNTTISSYIIESLSAGISAQVLTFPIIFSKIGSVQLLSFIPSMLVGWLVPLIINGSAVSIVLASVLSCCRMVQPVSDLVATILLWLPADLFLHALQFLSNYNWGDLTNPWLEQ
jgi:competence protein ComEC